MPRNSFTAAACLATILGATGCTSLQGYPKRDGAAQEAVSALSAKYTMEEMIRVYNLPATGKKEYRDEAITARMLIIDIRFAEFEKSMFSQRSSLKVGGDTLKSALGVAGSLTSAGQTSQILSGVSGAFDATSASVDSNVYRDKTQNAVIAMMRAERSKVRAEILKRLKLSDDEYPLAVALSDLEDYYVAGSVPGALAAITADAGQQKAVADFVIKTQLTPSKRLIQNTQAVQTSIYQALDQLTESQMQGLIATPPAAIPPVAITVLGARFPTGLAIQNEADSRNILKFIFNQLAVSNDDAAFDAWQTAIEKLIPPSP